MQLLGWPTCPALAGPCHASSSAAEAAAWEKLARALHEEAPIGGLGAAPETAFGTLDALTVRSLQQLFCSSCRHEAAQAYSFVLTIRPAYC